MGASEWEHHVGICGPIVRINGGARIRVHGLNLDGVGIAAPGGSAAIVLCCLRLAVSFRFRCPAARQETGRAKTELHMQKTYRRVSRTATLGRRLLFLCGHALCQKCSDSMANIPLLVDSKPLLTLGFRQCLEFGLESVRKVAF